METTSPPRLPVFPADFDFGVVVAAVVGEGDEFVGLLDAVHEDVPFTPAVSDDVDGELAALAGWLGLTFVR